VGSRDVPTRWAQPAERSIRRPARSPRRLWIILGTVAVLIVASVSLHAALGSAGSFPMPGKAALAGLTLRQRIVAIAESQVGYKTNPANSYCNKYSAYWSAGSPDCPAGELQEQWCADFAAWAWQNAGAHFTYGYAPGEINGAAASFYRWAVRHGTWHPAGSGYRPQPGDVAVYGLDLASLTAAHVAVVTGFSRGAAGPDVVNGDGDRTGFSVVEKGRDQYRADSPAGDSVLSGYASPLPG
jgi:CHAP domain